jgi:hypothetical protein
MRYLPTSFSNTRHAAVAVQVVLSLTVLLGMLAIVLDGGLLLAYRRQTQAAADASALAYAVAMVDPNKPDPAQAALAIAALNGAANDGTYSLITPNATSGGSPLHGIFSSAAGNGPVVGNFVGKAGTKGYATGYVEVVIEYDGSRLFSAIWGSGKLPVRGRAVACWGGSPANYWSASVLTLNAAKTNDVTDSGNGKLTVPNSIIANASITTNGKNAFIKSTGGVIQYGPTASASGNIFPAPTIEPTLTADPLASLALPNPSGMTVQSSSAKTITSSVTLQPGVYQGGLNITGGTVTLSPGIYYIEGGGLSLSGNSSTTLTDNGQGVLIFNGESNGGTSNPSSVGAFSVTGQANVSITPMSSGTWQGISFFQDRNATAAFNIMGNGNTNIGGLVYAPNATATLAGNGVIGGSTSFITNQLVVTGNGNFTPPTIKVPLPGSGSVSGVWLVE